MSFAGKFHAFPGERIAKFIFNAGPRVTLVKFRGGNYCAFRFNFRFAPSQLSGGAFVNSILRGLRGDFIRFPGLRPGNRRWLGTEKVSSPPVLVIVRDVTANEFVISAGLVPVSARTPRGARTRARARVKPTKRNPVELRFDEDGSTRADFFSLSRASDLRLDPLPLMAGRRINRPPNVPPRVQSARIRARRSFEPRSTVYWNRIVSRLTIGRNRAEVEGGGNRSSSSSATFSRLSMTKRESERLALVACRRAFIKRHTIKRRDQVEGISHLAERRGSLAERSRMELTDAWSSWSLHLCAVTPADSIRRLSPT